MSFNDGSGGMKKYREGDGWGMERRERFEERECSECSLKDKK